MSENSKRVIDVLIASAQFCIIVWGFVWASFRFRREGVHYHRVEFKIDCEHSNPHSVERVLEVTVAAS